MIPRALLVAAALVAALAPLPEGWVERWFSRGFYPRLQAIVTPISNLTSIALLDIAVGVWGLAAVALIARRLRHGRRGWLAVSLRALLVSAAVVYLVFLVMWGFNYRRVPLERQLDYDVARVTPEAAVRFASAAARTVNASHLVAHATPFDEGRLAETFARAQHALGATRPAVTGRPKRSLVTWYFRRAAIDGMTDPFFLEIILNPELLTFERPFVLAHEWAHLAGYADESEANFVAWVTCALGDAPAQYSGWLFAYQLGAGSVPRATRRQIAPLDAGPRNDIRAIVARYQRASPMVRHAAREVYDSYLRANRVEEGIASYDLAVRLMLGTTYEAGALPRLRSR
jgi:hypothetical protein